ncbi:MAG: hypothetical protein QM640_09045 [Niabella sp.]
MSESREHIRNRMLQHAARVWGYPETEDVSSFDPLVNLLLSVNAAEFERLSNEIHHSRNRVMERIMQLLAPDVLTGPHQASAILNAGSIEDTVRLSAKEQFFLTQNVKISGGQHHNIDVYFTPADAFYINKCSIKYAAANNKIFRYSDSVTKELVAIAGEQQFLPNATLWLAVDQPHINLTHTQFYFQYRSEVNKDVFYNQLKNAVWRIDDKEIVTRPGFNTIEAGGADWYAEQIIYQQSSITDKFIKLVKQQYEQFFITIEAAHFSKGVPGKSLFPQEIKKVFEQNINNIEGEKLTWIRITFPENITGAMLEDLSVYANAFPVVNRRLYEISYRMQELMNVIPLVTGENQFFDIDAIVDENGKQFHVRENEDQDNHSISVLMRNGGAGRFDERDANVVLENLVQLLRDESAAFSNLGKDLISQEVKALQQSITKIEQLVGRTDNQTSFTPYLMVRNRGMETSRFLYITYWSTNGALANRIRAGTRLQPYKTSSVKASSTFLLTPTQGGKNRLGQSESVIAYKYALLSKDRIMSKEDIRLYCKLALGNMVREVQIKKGFMVSAENSSGFMKTIDITITIPRKNYDEALESGEIAHWEKSIAMELGEKSMAFIPFRVFVKSVNIYNSTI